jgi:hypothetical protein
MRNPFKSLEPHQNAILPDRCYFEGDEYGLKLRFGVEGEVSPVIHLEPHLVGTMYESLHNYLTERAKIKRENPQPEQPATN